LFFINLDKPALKEFDKKHEEKKTSAPLTKTDLKKKNNPDQITVTSHQLREATFPMTETIKDRKVPEEFEKFQNREVISEFLNERGQDVAQNNPKASIHPIGKRQVIFYQ